MDFKAPKHYKDPIKIAQYIEERKAEMLSDGAFTHPLAGQLKAITILPVASVTLNDRGSIPFDKEQVTFTNSETCNQYIGAKALEFILEHSLLPAEAPSFKARLVAGCKLQALLRIMAIEYISVHGALPFSLHWTVGLDPHFRYNELPGFIDPVRVICGYRGPQFPEIPLDKLALRLGLPVPDETSSTDMAVFAYVLCTRLGL